MRKIKLDMLRPAPELRPYIKTYWHLQMADSLPNSQTIVPNGMMGLCFYLNDTVNYDGFGDVRTTLGGQRLKALHAFSCGLHALGVEFMPYGVRLFFSMPISDLFGLLPTPQEINDRGLIELEERIMTSPTLPGRIGTLNDFFLARLRNTSTEELNIGRIRSSLAPSGNGRRHTVDAMAAGACLGQKQFRRIFTEHVGMTPKHYLRLCRLQRALTILLKQGQPDNASSLTNAAWTSGYFDLPHMDAEFRDIVGHTPSEFRSLYRPDSFAWVDIQATCDSIKHSDTKQ